MEKIIAALKKYNIENEEWTRPGMYELIEDEEYKQMAVMVLNAIREPTVRVHGAFESWRATVDEILKD